ncbi:MAG: hypothetical protein QM734_13475 [Cyclobacteriaceae bacterium]
MKKFLTTKSALIGFGLATVSFIVYYFVSHPAKATYSDINPAFAEYISSYTSSSVTSGSVIRIVLTNDAVDSTAIGESSTKLFDFSPSLKGTTIWLDKRTVEFRPSSRMKSGQVYEVLFYLSKVVQVSKDLSTFKYTFQVIPQNYELAINNVRPYEKTELKRQKIEATIFTADFAESVSVERMVSAEQENNSLKISWSHTSDGKQHSFVVEDVSRKEVASKVMISVKGSGLDIDHDESEEVEIPALNDFKVTNARVEQGTNQVVVIQFSDPLNEKQNLEGLITLANVGTVDFEIKDNEVRVFPPVRQAGNHLLTVEEGVLNILNYKMKKSASIDLTFEQLAPATRFTGKGSILPSSDGLILPFEAVNLKAVNVQIIKIYESNILQFLQTNSISGNEQLRRVGKPVLSTKISLENSGVTDLGKWNRFTLDLAKLISAEPGAIYQVRIKFKKEDAVYVCDQSDNDNSGEESNSFEQEEDFNEDQEFSYLGFLWGRLLL